MTKPGILSENLCRQSSRPDGGSPASFRKLFADYPPGVLDRTAERVYTCSSKYPTGVPVQKEAVAVEEGCSCCKTKKRDEAEYTDLIHRLNRIEGQVRGVRRMVENDAYCVDILTQVSAITAALNSFNKVLLASHIRTCVADDIRAGNDEVVDELVKTLQKLMK